uniref:Uncharacterized protein n=1 Tax=Panagrolaimus sp. PS1159 TaxID=55785 RepID=A0AC35ESH3_9BILA
MNYTFFLLSICAILLVFSTAAPVHELKKSTELAANEIKFSKPSSSNAGPSPASTLKKRSVNFAVADEEDEQKRFRQKFHY